MIYRIKKVNGNIVELGDPIYVKINVSIDAPASDLVAIFNFNDETYEIRNIYVYDDTTMVFNGMVDEQKVECGPNGTFLTISARNKAGMLVDNEAEPQVYDKPSLSTIFRRHIAPYGFIAYYGDDTAFASEFVVSKGMTEWGVLKKFCNTFLDSEPYVVGNDGINAANGPVTQYNFITLSNSGKRTRYTSIKKTIKRYGVISKIKIKTANASGYTTEIIDESATQRGIVKTKYYNYTNGIQSISEYGDSIIKDSKKDQCTFDVECVGSVYLELGAMVNINDDIFGEVTGLKLTKIKYILDSSGETTQLTMRMEEM